MKNFISSINKVLENRWFLLLMLPLAALFVTFYSFTTSPLFLNEGGDSCVFKSMGLAILQGKTPYVDFFDHKGPILYFINALGQWLIPGRLGIFILQIIGETVAFLFMYKIARLYVNGIKSFVVLMVALLIYGGWYAEGNQCEEWILMAFVPSLYFALHYLKNKIDQPHPIKYSLLYGFCFSMAFYIRPNDAVSLIGGLMLGIFAYMIYNKQFKLAIMNAIAFLSMFIIVSIPIFVYFIEKDALSDFIYGLFVFNSKYSGGIKILLGLLIKKSKLFLLFLLVVWVVLAQYAKQKTTLWIVVPSILLFALLKGNNGYPHYNIGLVPLLVLMGSMIMMQKYRSIVLLTLCFLFVFSYGSGVNYIKGMKNGVLSRIYMISSNSEQSLFYEESDKLLDMVPDSEKDQIWNYNLTWIDGFSYNSIFLHRGIVQKNRVPLYFMNVVDPDKKLESVQIESPLWIVLSHKYEDVLSSFSWIEENYTLVYQTDTAICDISLYKRNL